MHDKYLYTCAYLAYSLSLHDSKIVADQTVGLMIVLCKMLYITGVLVSLPGLGVTTHSAFGHKEHLFQTFQERQQLG